MKLLIPSIAILVILAHALPAQQIVQYEGHGHHTPATTNCVTPAERQNIMSQLQSSRSKLIKEGILNDETRGGSVPLSFPLTLAPELDWNGAHAVSGYVDQDPSASYQNYACTNRTYNGHKGTDYYLWPFDGYLMDNDLVYVQAAAPGIIIFKHDGEFDQQCEWQTGVTWNAVYVEHADGTIAWYGHLKAGTLTTKSVGESVAVGEYLGVVGSSGFSSGPHLHLELQNADGTLIDPYYGDCNATDEATSWADQDPYWEMALNTLLTHDAVMEFGCPSANEEPNIQEYFNSFETVILAAYFKEQFNGAQVDYVVRTPLGTVYDSWTQNMVSDYESSYWYWSFQVPVGDVTGTWTFEATYNGDTFIREFYVNQEASGILDDLALSLEIYPNPAHETVIISLTDEQLNNGMSTIRLIDTQGREVHNRTVDSGERRIAIDIRTLSESVYLIQLNSGNDIYTSQVLIKR